jgi:protein TonB
MCYSKSRNGILKQKYRKVLESSTVLSLIIVTFLFYSFKTFKHESKFLNKEPDIIKVVPPPKTQQNKPKPPPSRPKIPVEAEDDELLDDVTIDDTEIDFTKFSTELIPKPEDPDEIYEFFAVSEKPVLIKKVQPHYPPLAIIAEIEGTVTVKVLIDTKGNIEKAEILKSIPMLDDAALVAAMQCKFKPAKQRDKFVKVLMSIPFKFSLRTRSL